MADQIKVDNAKLEKWASGLENVSDALADAKSILQRLDTSGEWWTKVSVSRSLRLRDVGGSVELGRAHRAVDQMAQTLGQYQRRVETLSGDIRKASRQFEEAEKKVNAWADNMGAGTGANIDKIGQLSHEYKPGVAEEGKKSGNWWESMGSFATTIVAAFGDGGKMVGDTLDLALKVFGGNATSGDLIKYLADSGETIASWIDMDKRYKKLSNLGKDYANKLHDKEFLGLRKYMDNVKVKGNTLKNFGKNLGEGFKKGMSSAAAWITSGISSAVDNFTEWKTGAISGDRAVVEWATETAGNVVLASATTALAGAAITAITGVAAPAVAVAAAGGLVVWGADCLWKNINNTDKGLVESFGSWVGEGYDKLKNWFSSSSITAAWAIG